MSVNPDCLYFRMSAVVPRDRPMYLSIGLHLPRGMVMAFTRENGSVSPMPLGLSVAWAPLRVSRLFHRIVAFSLSSFVSWL